ncbi:MAG: glycoside hydrolase family 95-like protein [Blautia sp.]|mgnify:FL=1
MLCAHPPFQIDGNFGFAAAVLEMLVQYQDDRILFLPALPKEWKDGKIRGLKAPGGITIDFAWKDGRITECSLKSLTDTVRTLLYNGTEKEITLKAD